MASAEEELHGRIAAVRNHRDSFREELAGGALTLGDLFDRADADPVLGGTKLLGLIEAMPPYGKVQTRRAFEAHEIDERIRVAALTNEKRSALAAELAG